MSIITLRSTRKYKISYISITIILSTLIVYLYTISNTNEVEINYIYFFIYLFVVFMANAIRLIIVDMIPLLFLISIIIYYFI